MSPGAPLADAEPDSRFGIDLPSLPHLFDRIEHTLAHRGQLGLVSIMVLQREDHRHASWQGYEAMMREISNFLGSYRRDRMRESDRLFGPGMSGNAFVLLLDAPRDGRLLGPTEIDGVSRRVRRALSAHLSRELPRGISELFGCYVGGAMMQHDPGVPLERLVYRALAGAFADALRDKDREQRRSSVALRRILRSNLVRAVYQPVVWLAARRVIGYEALTRVPGDHFETVELLFKAAQQHDSLWRLERLCRRKALEGLPTLDGEQMLFLNIEPDSIHDPELRDLPFRTLVSDAGLRPSQIVLEVTEHSAVRDFAAFRRSLGHFREHGFRLAMDDVGSGYSGLQAIAEIAPDFIKVDMTLVRNIHTNRIKRELISTIRRFADSTGITLIAEGVESLDELRVLRGVGVRFAQGFLFARPGSPPGDPDFHAVE
jgi:EAL domain-containing protein (putative c-di-GMP-specific phosphodiesterase class I)